MSEPYHQPEHISFVETMLADLSGEDLAAKGNALTGGCMRGEDALKVAKMVALAAMHAPGTEVIVAGFAACVSGDQLNLYLHGELASREIPKVETEEL